MSFRILAVMTVLLAALVVHQYRSLGELRGELADARRVEYARARADLVDRMDVSPDEITRTVRWLNDFYKESDGLQRPEGLWIDGHPDYAGIGAWVFDVYLRHRLKGESEDQARVAVVKAVQATEEWHAKHPH